MSEPKESKGKPFPVFYTDEEAERFMETADLSEYDFSGFRPFNFELRAKDARVNLRLPVALLNAVKIEAVKSSVPYQRLIRDFVAQGLEANAKAKGNKTRKAS